MLALSGVTKCFGLEIDFLLATHTQPVFLLALPGNSQSIILGGAFSDCQHIQRFREHRAAELCRDRSHSSRVTPPRVCCVCPFPVQSRGLDIDKECLRSSS